MGAIENRLSILVIKSVVYDNHKSRIVTKFNNQWHCLDTKRTRNGHGLDGNGAMELQELDTVA